MKRKRKDKAVVIDKACFKPPVTYKTISDFYKVHQYVHIKGVDRHKHGALLSQLREVHSLFPQEVTKTLTVENYDGGGDSVVRGLCHRDEPIGVDDIFGTGPPQAWEPTTRKSSWYVSFIAQKTENNDNTAFDLVRNALPVESILDVLDMVTRAQRAGHRTTTPVWCFLGNAGKQPINGRKEHLDSVSHDGTWHYQASGSKDWVIRPAESSEWGDSTPSLANGAKHLVLTVEEGDIICINTRLWWHQTIIS